MIPCMPLMKNPVITKAWRHKGETGKIHYIAKRADGTPRHLWIGEGHPLYEVLEDHLAAVGYTGPRRPRSTSTRVPCGSWRPLMPKSSDYSHLRVLGKLGTGGSSLLADRSRHRAELTH